jgi:hypothetical protein
MLDGDMKMEAPVISIEKPFSLAKTTENPSNLPYLHRNPAV